MPQSIEELYNTFFVVGHRGASAYEPENTVRSIRRAFEMGADAVEVDARVSKDGHVVIIHDETVDRTTNGTGLVSELSLEEIRALDAGKGEKIPTLQEVLEEIRGKGCLFLEIKVDEAAVPSLSLVESME
ncbi:MAG: glycerophosphodiester phosphodiesterase, partial [Thermoproteota archaeon]